MKKAILWDMDGVLINDEWIQQRSWRGLCAGQGIEIDENELAK